jgi:N-acetylglutamate synthase
VNPAAQIPISEPADPVCRRVEEASINAWPAMQQLLVDGWLLRFSQGFTKRANSVIPLYPDNRPVTDKVRFCENVYARERLKCIFRLSSIGGHGELDAMLARRGYRHQDPTEVLGRSLAGSAALSPRMCLLGSARWLDAYGSLTGMSEAARRLHGAILRAIPLPCAYAVIDTPNAPLACGLAVVEDDVMGLFDVVTAPDARRRGHGRELVSSLLAWGESQGARFAYLQMVEDNHPARGLYVGLGFATLYRYWYRIAD